MHNILKKLLEYIYITIFYEINKQFHKTKERVEKEGKLSKITSKILEMSLNKVVVKLLMNAGLYPRKMTIPLHSDLSDNISHLADELLDEECLAVSSTTISLVS